MLHYPDFSPFTSSIFTSPFSIIIGNSDDFIAISFSLPCSINPFFILLKFIFINPKNLLETAPQNYMIKAALSIFDTSYSLTGHIITIFSA